MAKSAFTDAAALEVLTALQSLAVFRRHAAPLEGQAFDLCLDGARKLVQHARSTTEHDRRRAHVAAGSAAAVIRLALNPQGLATPFSRGVEAAAMAVAAICEGQAREAAALTQVTRHMVRRLNRAAIMAPAYTVDA